MSQANHSPVANGSSNHEETVRKATETRMKVLQPCCPNACKLWIAWSGEQTGQLWSSGNLFPRLVDSPRVSGRVAYAIK